MSEVVPCVVSVRLFASARDAVGVGELALTGVRSVGDVRRRLAERSERLAALLPRCRLALNEEFAADEAEVKTGDVVAVLPPVSGG